MVKQNEAIRLAFELEYHRAYEAAAELRRLHAEVSDLKAALVVLLPVTEERDRLEAQRDELLDALKYCRAVFPQDRWADDTKKMIDAAIAKATGEHQ